MKKREQGVLTVEASIVLTLMLLFILFLFSFGRVYRAQNLVSHASLQSADAIAMESFLRETALQSDISEIVHLTSHITNSSAISADSLESLRSADLPKIVREKFIAAIAGSEAKADEKLRKMGIKDGLSGVDFSQCKMDLANDDVIVAITYTIEMQFPVFGFDEITVTKAAKAKTFGEILFAVTTKPNNPGWGTTSGDSKAPHGSTIQISATPKYGYKFVSWSDGVTDNPRTVTVTDAMEFVAIFEKDQFGVNLGTRITYNTSYAGITHRDYGTVTGAGSYAYLDNATITATPAANYRFVGWDDNGDGVPDDTNPTRTITVDKIYDIKAIFKPATYRISVGSNNSAYGIVQASQGTNKGTSIQAEYGSRVLLTAVPTDSVRYIFNKWSNNSTLASTSVIVEGEASYEATFATNTYMVTFYNGTTPVHTTEVIRGSSINGSKSIIPSTMAANAHKDGAIFAKWTYAGRTFTASTTVNSDISVFAAWKYNVVLNANGGQISGLGSLTVTVLEGDSFNFSAYTPRRNGFRFDGWFCDGVKYTGNIPIYSGVTVTASWTCKHKYDNGATMYVPISGSGGGCTNTVTTYRCDGCGHEYSVTGKRSCKYSGWCGTVHSCSWRSWCTSGSTHRWNGYGCITCVYCGRCENGAYRNGVYRSYSVWCVMHNGQKNRTIKSAWPHA